MSDLIRREDAIEILEDEGWNGDSLRRIHAIPAVQPDARIKEYEDAYQYALHLAEALRENYPPNPGFRFLGDLVGLLTQIDNMVAGFLQPDLTDPVVVHANMVRGTIAKLTLDQIIHLYGVDALCRALVPAIVKEAAFAAPHVNETPKSEHEAGNMLTPATKGGA